MASKLLTVFSILLLTSCGDSYITNNFVETPPVDEITDTLEATYDVNVEFITLYVGQVPQVEIVCNGARACAYNQGFIVTSSLDCATLVHEYLHFILYELYNNTDPAHKRKEWRQVDEICMAIAPEMPGD